MKRRQAAIVGAIVTCAGAVWLIPGGSASLNLLVAVLGDGAAGTVLTGIGGRCLALCLGEAFAVGLGTTVPLLGVLIQPAIAGMIYGDNDPMGLLFGGITITAAAAGVLLFRHTLTPLMAAVLLSTGIIIGLTGYEAWIKRRLSSGGGYEGLQ